jgi:PTH1 family peptidyl-tRNA hydrolase
MKIILAQGNPGETYARSRHNIGWMLLDAIAHGKGVSFKAEKKFFADIASYTDNGETVILVKPTTFYNETGRSARALADFYKVTPATDILVIHDDLALPFGTVRTRAKGSDAGNNGVKSLNAHLGQDYWRIRVGIWNELRDQIDDVKFVLGTFTGADQQIIKKDIRRYVEQSIDSFVQGTLTASSQALLP